MPLQSFGPAEDPAPPAIVSPDAPAAANAAEESAATRDVLDRPGVAVRVAEVDEVAPGLLVDLAGIHAVVDQPLAGGVQVVGDDLQAPLEPGVMSVIPVPMTIEHAEPGGVSWTKRSSSFTW